MGLTIKEIEGAKPTDKPYKLADGGGLCLLIPPSGAKLCRWRYRFDGKEKMMALGEYPIVTLKEARERHSDARKALANGVDPMAERKAVGEARQKEAEARQREAENSFENVAREWWKWWKIGNPLLHGVDQHVSLTQSGGNMEGIRELSRHHQPQQISGTSEVAACSGQARRVGGQHEQK